MKQMMILLILKKQDLQSNRIQNYGDDISHGQPEIVNNLQILKNRMLQS